MKAKQILILSWSIFCALHSALSTAQAQGTAFTYQGQLSSNGVPLSGNYDFQFALSNAPSGGSQIGSTITETAIGVTNGFFSTTLDFGAVFTNEAIWLAVSVRSNNVPPYTPMTPLQELTPTPYAVTAENVTGAITLTQLPSTVVTNDAAATLGSLTLNGNLNLPNNNVMGIGYEALNYDNYAASGGELLGGATVTNNMALGYQALYYNVYVANNGTIHDGANATNNMAVGYQALYNNVYVGDGGSTSSRFNANNNTAIGYQALFNNSNIGDNGGYNGPASANNNTAIGYQALFNNGNIGSTFYDIGFSANNNIAIGYQAGYNLTGSVNNIDIGNPGTNGDNGIIRIGVPGLQTATYLAGTVYANGVSLSSDRNAKENFAVVDPRQVLDKVAALPVTKWNYKTDKDAEHIGPMAQDFQAAFGLNGPDDKHISVVDESGVALAAIQGLNQKLNEKDAEIEALKQSMAELKQMMQALEEKK